MKKIAFLIVLGVPMLCLGKSAEMMRGGYGFLYPDNNSFNNTSEFAASHSLAVQADYSRQNTTKFQSFTPSAVWGNGRIGLGAYANRVGNDLLKSETDLTTGTISSDSAGVGGGFALLKEKLFVGGKYERSIDSGQTDTGAAQGSITYMGKTGFSLGAGFGTTMGRTTNVQSGIGGIGYAFKTGTTLEANVIVSDVKNTKDWIGRVAATLGNDAFYMGVAYLYEALAKDHSGQARLGFIVAKAFDFSAHAESLLEKGAVLTYGGSLRMAF